MPSRPEIPSGDRSGADSAAMIQRLPSLKIPTDAHAQEQLTTKSVDYADYRELEVSGTRFLQPAAFFLLLSVLQLLHFETHAQCWPHQSSTAFLAIFSHSTSL